MRRYCNNLVTAPLERAFKGNRYGNASVCIMFPFKGGHRENHRKCATGADQIQESFLVGFFGLKFGASRFAASEAYFKFSSRIAVGIKIQRHFTVGGEVVERMEFFLNPYKLARPLFASLQASRKHNKTQTPLLTSDKIDGSMSSSRNSCHIIKINSTLFKPGINHTSTEHSLARPAF